MQWIVKVKGFMGIYITEEAVCRTVPSDSDAMRRYGSYGHGLRSLTHKSQPGFIKNQYFQIKFP